MALFRSLYNSFRRMNYRCELFPRSHTINDITIRSYEPLNTHSRLDKEDILSRLINEIEDRDVIYDVGANIGTYTLAIATANKVTVISFEPNPEVYRWLIANVRANKLTSNIQTLPIGLSDTNEITTIQLAHRESTLVSETNDIDQPTVAVPVYQLDTLIEHGLKPPNQIKIDVEGHGPSVIDGAQETIQKYKPTIYIESHSNMDDIKSSLSSTEYTIKKFGAHYVAKHGTV